MDWHKRRRERLLTNWRAAMEFRAKVALQLSLWSMDGRARAWQERKREAERKVAILSAVELPDTVFGDDSWRDPIPHHRAGGLVSVACSHDRKRVVVVYGGTHILASAGWNGYGAGWVVSWGKHHAYSHRLHDDACNPSVPAKWIWDSVRFTAMVEEFATDEDGAPLPFETNDLLRDPAPEPATKGA